ncbi:sugar ABC transporter ATP-binding protein [Pseudonocardia kujensis]|uniref:sugar ABC transporter ATP-binding protein n=1 Tax=Pseudonocardia kujensis TaxID=1128675 RepID=UPI001E303593|nr:sugar ABC transporter ATP-binding protein [Pseudonocardia kujensis]MCE0765099.1 sugar ABC transporter ATP-binding protein [Pseudonocardia kujensis]
MPAIECVGASKRFAGKYAVHGADLVVEPGTIHALVGENGAGKSTLLGMISGRLAPDEGVVRIFGDELTSAGPRDSRRHGLVAVYQELTMVPAFTAAQNVFLGQMRSRGGAVLDAAMRRRYLELCAEFDVHIDPDTPARDLSVSQRQIVEIMRGVQAQSRVLMLDEPSAALAEHEREVLYRILNRLRDNGTTVVFVSHNLDEVLLLSDRITVMRDSRVVVSAPRAEWPSKQSIVQRMVGRAVVIERRTEFPPLGEESLAVRDVTLPGVLNGMALTARAGEIVGLWGLVGSGRTTFFRSLCGLERRSTGGLRLGGEERPWPRSMRAAVAEGIVMVPESRRHALVMEMDATANYWLGRRGPGRGLLSPRREREDAVRDATFFGFDRRRVQEPVRTLSGGNQQKVLLAKWAGHRPRVFLVDEPTRGIDVGAKAEVLASLVRLAEDGATIVVTSSELEEVLAICDRLLVVAHGEIVRELSTRDTEVSVEEIVRYGFGEGDAA